jgi:hypothetical protein
MSRIFSMNGGSVDSSSDSTRSGRRPRARYIRLTVLRLRPSFRVNDKVLRWVASPGEERRKGYGLPPNSRAAAGLLPPCCQEVTPNFLRCSGARRAPHTRVLEP